LWRKNVVGWWRCVLRLILVGMAHCSFRLSYLRLVESGGWDWSFVHSVRVWLCRFVIVLHCHHGDPGVPGHRSTINLNCYGWRQGWGPTSWHLQWRVVRWSEELSVVSCLVNHVNTDGINSTNYWIAKYQRK
jgi:hypothetical protein